MSQPFLHLRRLIVQRDRWLPASSWRLAYAAGLRTGPLRRATLVHPSAIPADCLSASGKFGGSTHKQRSHSMLLMDFAFAKHAGGPRIKRLTFDRPDLVQLML
jgi:hypothetical protein